MNRFLQRIPTWAVVGLGAIGIAGLTALSTMPLATGTGRAALIVAFAVCGVGAVVGPVLQHCQTEASRKLDVDVTISGTVLSLDQVPADIGQWMALERTKLPAWPEPKPPRPPRSDMPDGYDETTLLDVISGKALAEAGQVASLREQMAASIGRDTRSAADYRVEVDEYLEDCGEVLEELALMECARHAASQLTVMITNRTGRTWESLEVRLHLDGDVAALEQGDEEDDERRYSLPRRPSAPGTPDLSRSLSFAPSLNFSLGGPELRSGPTIDNSHSADITWPTFTLRAHQTKTLDPVFLVTYGAPGHIFDGQWSVTAVNGEGRPSGKVKVACHDRYRLAELQPYVDGF